MARGKEILKESGMAIITGVYVFIISSAHASASLTTAVPISSQPELRHTHSFTPPQTQLMIWTTLRRREWRPSALEGACFR